MYLFYINFVVFELGFQMKCFLFKTFKKRLYCKKIFFIILLPNYFFNIFLKGKNSNTGERLVKE